MTPATRANRQPAYIDAPERKRQSDIAQPFMARIDQPAPRGWLKWWRK